MALGQFFLCWQTVGISMILPFCHCQTHHTGLPPKRPKCYYPTLPRSPMMNFCHYLAKNHATKNVIEPKWVAWARTQYRRTPWQSATVWLFAGVPTRQVMFIAFPHHHHRNWWWYDWKTNQQSTTFRSPTENERENGWWGGRAQWIGAVTPKICPTKIKWIMGRGDLKLIAKNCTWHPS